MSERRAERRGVERRGGLGRGLAALIPTAPPVEPAPPPPPAEARPPEPTAILFGGPRPQPRPEPDGSAPTGNGTPSPQSTPTPQPPPVGESAPVTETGAVYSEVDVTAIEPNPHQPRAVFDEEALAELEHSIREFGLLQPVVVRASGDRYQLVMGERRWRAAQRAGLTRIPAIVRTTGDDVLLRDALLENIHRVQLTPLEEAAAYEQLLGEFGVTHAELADRLGRSRPVVTNTIRLLKLPVSVQRRVAAGVLSAGHARALLGLDDPGQQEDLAARIVAEGLSVRATEEAVLLARREEPAPPRPPRRKPAAGATTHVLAERLSHTFDTRVRVEMGQRKGRIVVEFGSVEDLERIAGLMGGTAG
jgi:ParB family transcriptional regulator, chromosome partitioning protein